MQKKRKPSLIHNQHLLNSQCIKCNRTVVVLKKSLCQYHHKMFIEERNQSQNKLCSIDICMRGYWCKGFCIKHYLSRRRTGHDPNSYTINGPVATILAGESYFLIDVADLSLVLEHKWIVSTIDRKAYPYTFLNGKKTILHMYLTGKTQDHINRKPRDNRRANLRDCTVSQNNINNALRSDNSSGYKGVSRKYHNRWQANISVNGYQRYLGLFKTSELAAEAYNKAALESFGDFAFLNVIN